MLELRQYTLRPGQRERLVALFERAFVESQEALGIVLPGQFIDAGDADRFVWLRGLGDLASRAKALASFYDGPVWHAHRDEANATMIDSDDVLLLRPLRPLELGGPVRPPAGTSAAAGRVGVMICPLRAGTARAVARAFETGPGPRLEAHGARVLGTYVTEPGQNDFPRLPVREGEPVFVWFAGFEDAPACHRWQHAIATDEATATAFAQWQRRLDGPPQYLDLIPTPRSLLRGGCSAAATGGMPDSSATV
ncbi:NIPSNAP family protein [Dyella sp.]|uniref:NIPSNAP family protein n=1 Tax=Dyella sp. TaxID=1869338 RepID=UPI002D7944A8|nr:NIPSNAP family protein [Dyella sp.]HET6431643.1 NIPSNAP family protein [Dyella sp.]